MTRSILALSFVAFAACRPTGAGRDSFLPEDTLGPSFFELMEVRARKDGRVYYCSGVRGFGIVAAANRARLSRLDEPRSSHGDVRFPRCQHLAYDGELAYFSSRGDEIQPDSFLAAFDTSSIPAREIASRVDPGRSYEGLAAADGKLYAAMHAAGLAVFEARGTRLVELGVASGLVNAWSVDVTGGLAYVADGVGGLAVVDVVDPSSPRVLGRVDLEGTALHVEVAGEVAWVAAGSGGVVAVDVSDPAAPAVLSTTDTPGTALELDVVGDHLFLADWNEARIFDVRDPRAPRLVQTERPPLERGFPRVLGIGAREDGAVFLGEWQGLRSYTFFPDRAAPDLWIGRREVDFGGVLAGTTEAEAVLVQNTGNAALTIDRIEAADSSFEVVPEALDLAPGERAAIEIVHTAADTSARRSDLVLVSNDPDEPRRVLEIEVNRSGRGTGDSAPEVEVRLVDGSHFSLAGARGQVVVLAYFATF